MYASNATIADYLRKLADGDSRQPDGKVNAEMQRGTHIAWRSSALIVESIESLDEALGLLLQFAALPVSSRAWSLQMGARAGYQSACDVVRDAITWREIMARADELIRADQ